MSATTPTPTGYLALACLTWMLYDYLITLNDEIEFIWTRKWTFTTVLFLLMRWSTLLLLLNQVVFFVFLENVSKSSCDALSWGTAIATAVVLLEVEIVLQLRIYAMYERSRRILWINACLCGMECLCAALIIAKYFSRANFVPVPNWIIGACYDIRPKQLGVVWVPPMCYELYLASLAVYKIVQTHRASEGSIANNLLTVLVRDSIGQFFFIIAAMVVNCVLWVKTEITPGDSAVNIVHACGAIGGVRLILNMRSAASRPVGLPVSERGTAAALTSSRSSKHFEMQQFPIPG
ncbi:hypothetical protein AURDEDRAFT_186801 [Auricularia subglabra TFB-10046 SS5]|uniref:DUF6533 domain-containing protein n=1 Tax=Auricularia subglabra (strain TFB-10046 / SS5) TaxID=717982 RepID=J0LJQ0_AURST|nr:hypothetical protein AURDEDRAFT_186801 [Auricularia subglabra TFB-10046 SS5]